jgi:hypothetical protein
MEDENLQNNIIESKEDNLESSPEEEYEEVEEDVEVEEEVETEEMEFSLGASEINEWINELTRLKEDKGSVDLEVDEENSLRINFEEDEYEEVEVEDDEEDEEEGEE